MPSRRKLIELDADEVRDYLNTEKTLIIVSNGRRGYPHAMPMWFAVLDDGSIVCTTFRKSQKVLNWQRDPKATLLVETGEEYAELKGVMIYATCEIVDELEEVKDTLAAINAKGRELAEGEWDKLREAVSGTAPKRVVLRFRPERYITWDHSRLGGRY